MYGAVQSARRRTRNVLIDRALDNIWKHILLSSSMDEEHMLEIVEMHSAQLIHGQGAHAKDHKDAFHLAHS